MCARLPRRSVFLRPPADSTRYQRPVMPKNGRRSGPLVGSRGPSRFSGCRLEHFRPGLKCCSSYPHIVPSAQDHVARSSQADGALMARAPVLVRLAFGLDCSRGLLAVLMLAAALPVILFLRRIEHHRQLRRLLDLQMVALYGVADGLGPCR